MINIKYLGAITPPPLKKEYAIANEYVIIIIYKLKILKSFLWFLIRQKIPMVNKTKLKPPKIIDPKKDLKKQFTKKEISKGK